MTVSTFGLHSVFHDWSSLCQHSKSWTLLVYIYFGALRLHCSCCRGRVIQAEKKRLQLLLANFRKINSGETNSQAFRQHLPTSSDIYWGHRMNWDGPGEVKTVLDEADGLANTGGSGRASLLRAISAWCPAQSEWGRELVDKFRQHQTDNVMTISRQCHLCHLCNLSNVAVLCCEL